MYILYNQINLLINLIIIFLVLLIIISIFSKKIIEIKFFFKQIFKVKMLKEFILLVILIYFSLIVFFAIIYYFITFSTCNNNDFLTWLYFSSITLATVGYGDITPINSTMQLIATLESLIGYLSLPIIVSIGLSIIFKK